MQNHRLLLSIKKWPRKILCLPIVALILSGCAGYSQPLEKPPLPANLVAPCPGVPVFDSDSWDDLAEAYIDLVFMHEECRARHRAVVDTL